MKTKIKSHIVNLYMLALSDGDFASEELEVILKIAEDKGFTKQEFEQIISNPTEFVKVILADNVIEDEEVTSFMRFCRKFEFEEDESKELFDWLIELGKQEISTSDLEKEIEKLLNS